MRIIRATGKGSSFTQLPNALLRDRRLSWKARGLLAHLLSHVDGWQADAESLAQAGPDGRSAILAAFKELEVAGYVERRKHRVERGRWATDLFVFDTPQNGTGPAPPTSGFPTSENRTPAGRKPQVAPEVDPPTSDGPAAGEPTFGRPTAGQPAAVVEDHEKDHEEDGSLSLPERLLTEMGIADPPLRERFIHDTIINCNPRGDGWWITAARNGTLASQIAQFLAAPVGAALTSAHRPRLSTTDQRVSDALAPAGQLDQKTTPSCERCNDRGIIAIGRGCSEPCPACRSVAA